MIAETAFERREPDDLPQIVDVCRVRIDSTECPKISQRTAVRRAQKGMFTNHAAHKARSRNLAEVVDRGRTRR